MQQHCWLTKYKCFCRWYHTVNLWADHKKKLSDSWKYTWLLFELSTAIWDIFCIKKVQSDSFVQKIQKIQHASSAAIKKSDQNSHYISSDIEDLIEFKAVIKWACESNAEQNENSD